MEQAWWRRHEVSLWIAVCCVLLLTLLLDPQRTYWTNPQLSAVVLVRQWTMLTMFALGAAIVIIAGGIDLSTGSVIALSGTVCAVIFELLAPEVAHQAKAPLPLGIASLAIAGALLVGFLIGSLHAWLITVIELPPFVATLASLVGLRSLARAICERVTLATKGGVSTQIYVENEAFRYLAQSVWLPALLAIILSLALWIMLSRTILGRYLYALGGNEHAARLSGIETNHIKWVAYCLSAMLSALAGVLYVSDLGVAEPQTLGRGYELNAIAAAVVGGCSLQGGVGTIPGTVLGSLFLRVVIDGVAKVIKTGADVYEGLIVGVVVVFAVTFTGRRRGSDRVALLSGTLGWVTMLNLTLLAGLMTALVGSRLLSGRLRMDELWLSCWVMLAVLAWLSITRSVSSTWWRRCALVTWLLIVVLGGWGLDAAYPTIQQQRALAAVQQLQGKVTRNDAGIIVDLSATNLSDEQFRALAPLLDHLQPLVELRVAHTGLTDRATDLLIRWPSIQRLDLRGTALSPASVTRLRRTLAKTEIVLPEAKSP